MKKIGLMLTLCCFFAKGMLANEALQTITSPPIPNHLEFAGEKVPLEDPDVYERLEKEILSNTFFHSKTLSILKHVKRWKVEVNEILEKDSIPTDFFYLAVAESGLDNTVGSAAGARGMWQFLAPTGTNYGLEINAYVDERKDPYLATKAAASYLKTLKKMFGNWTAAAAAYNRGENGLQKAFENQKVTSYYDLYLNDETYRYVFRILAYKLIIENPADYGFILEEEEKYEPYEYIEIEVDSTIDDLPTFAIDHNTNYKMLRKYNPWLDPNARYTLPVSGDRVYIIRIPKAKS
ncbi:MAG: lytic transglycosylase domain-containing protein [Bacteroidetes bacterium]|nr:lytic transglycosylase domain-containing protein [Bacteroidota bacterium]